jgi:hypothetical protein
MLCFLVLKTTSINAAEHLGLTKMIFLLLQSDFIDLVLLCLNPFFLIGWLVLHDQ